MMVRFAQTCDYLLPSGACGKRSSEYSSWPSCRDCGQDICPLHAVPDSLEESHRDRDGDFGLEAIMTESVLCLACEAQDHEPPSEHLRWAEARLKAGLTHEPESLEPSDLDVMGRFDRQTL